MKHPTYADTGEPVLIGEEAVIVEWDKAVPSNATIRFASYVSPSDYPMANLRLWSEEDRVTFYKHRHNAIAAWEKLLEENQ